MKIISQPRVLRREVTRFKKQGKTIGFIPTMGALHDGHLSLIRSARADCDCVIVSIFVNPLQFGPREDLKKYPRTLKRDISLCKDYADIIFSPSVRSMYPDNFLTSVEVRQLSNVLCGASRPGHFRGVTTIVAKLFNMAQPDIAYFGQKDAQQAVIIRKMVADLSMPVAVKVLPIAREYDGLAMSSRNAYLTASQRKDAVVLYRSLVLAKKLARKGIVNCGQVIAQMRRSIQKTPSARIDYINIVDPKCLTPLKTIQKKSFVLLAVFIGKTRLIDAMAITRK